MQSYLTPKGIMEALAVKPGTCTLCGLAYKGKHRLCPKCRCIEGLPRDAWGWCSGKHRRVTVQKSSVDGRWLCLRCQHRERFGKALS